MGRDHDTYADGIDYALRRMCERIIEVMNANVRLRLRFFGWVGLLTIPLAVPLCVRDTAAVPPVVVVRMLDMPPSFEPKTVTVEFWERPLSGENVGNGVHHATDDYEMGDQARRM
jgi:hypothetical protein